MLDWSAFANGGAVFWVIAAVLLALLGVHFALYLRAVRPARGTLEWISMVDRPAASLCAEPFILRRMDGWCLAGVSLIAAACWAGPLLTVLLGQAYLTASARLEAVLRYLLAPVVSAQTLYLLLRRMTGNVHISMLAAAIFALDLSYGADAAATPFQLLAFAFVLLHLLLKGAFAPLVAAAAFLGVGAYFAPGVLCQLIVLLPALLFAAVYRCGAGERYAVRRLVGAALGFPAMTAAFLLLTQVPGAVLAGLQPFSGAFFLRVLLSALAALLSALPQSGTLLLSPVEPLLLSPVEPLLLIYALGAAAASLGTAVRRRQTGFWLAIWFFAANSALAAFGRCVPAVGCMPLIALVWAQWEARGGRWQVLLASAFLLSTALAGRLMQLLLGGI